MSAADLSVSFPSRGVIRLQGRSLLGGVEDPTCRRFLDRVCHAPEITEVHMAGGASPRAELRYLPEVDETGGSRPAARRLAPARHQRR